MLPDCYSFLICYTAGSLSSHWATDILDQLELPTSLLPPVVEAGTILGEVLAEWRGQFGRA